MTVHRHLYSLDSTACSNQLALGQDPLSVSRPPPSKQLSGTTTPLRASSSTDQGPADQAQLHLENTAYRDHISAVEAALSTTRESSIDPLGMDLLKATSDLQLPRTSMRRAQVLNSRLEGRTQYSLTTLLLDLRRTTISMLLLSNDIKRAHRSCSPQGEQKPAPTVGKSMLRDEVKATFKL